MHDKWVLRTIFKKVLRWKEIYTKADMLGHLMT